MSGNGGSSSVENSCELGNFVKQELGSHMAAATSSCVFCKVPFKDMSMMAGPRYEVKVLHCLHSACGKCLEDSLKQGRDALCPLCAARTGEQNYNKYLCNFAENQDLDYRAVEAIRHSPEEQFFVCDECVDACPAVQYCAQCVRRLCSECSDHHKRSKASAMHALTPLKEQEEYSMHRAALCAVHAHRELEFFCEACNVMCCRECIRQEHETHPYKLPSGRLVEAQRKVLQDHIHQLRSLGLLLQERHQQLTNSIRDFEDELGSSKQNIQNLEQQVKRALQDRRTQMLGEVEAFGDRQREAYETRRAALASTMLTRWRAIDFLEKVLTRGTNCEVLLLTGYISAQHLLGEDVLASKVAELALAASTTEQQTPVSWSGDVAAATQGILSMASCRVAGLSLKTSPLAETGATAGANANESWVPHPAYVSVPVGAAGKGKAVGEDARGTAKTEAGPVVNRAPASEVAEEAATRTRDKTGEVVAVNPGSSKHGRKVDKCKTEAKSKDGSAGEVTGKQKPKVLTTADGRRRDGAATGTKDSRAPRTISLADAVSGSRHGFWQSMPSNAKTETGPMRISLHEALEAQTEKAARAPTRQIAASSKASIKVLGCSNVHIRSNEELAERGLGVVRAVLGTEGEELGSFRSPCGMAVDSKRIYIADTLNHRIQVFDKFTLEVLGQVQLPDSQVGELNDPSGMCCIEVNGRVHLIVVEYGLDRLLSVQLALDSLVATSVRELAPKTFYGPFGVGVSQGRIVIADSCNHRCLVLTLNGQVLFEFGSRGCEQGQFEYPECIATFSDGSIAVSDKDNHRIQVFDVSGYFCHFIPASWSALRMQEGRKSKPGCLSGPMGMCVDRQDRVYVADCGSNRVQIFSRKGEFLWSSCTASSADGSSHFNFRSPTALAADDQGFIFVASDHCVQVF